MKQITCIFALMKNATGSSFPAAKKRKNERTLYC
jgi:hypothetical protein